MEKKVKESRPRKITAWALVFFVVSIISAFVFEYVTLPDYIGSIFYLALIPVACFIISMLHPKSVWHTPFICNPVGLLGTIFHPLAWTTLSEYLFWVGSLGFSVLGAIVGAKIGQRKINQAE